MFGIKKIKSEIRKLWIRVRDDFKDMQDLEQRVEDGFNVIQDDMRKLQHELRNPFIYDLGEEIFFGVNKGFIVIERNIEWDYGCESIKELKNIYYLMDRKDGMVYKKTEDQIIKESNSMDDRS